MANAEAIGLIETKGIVAAVEACDAALKAANVQFVEQHKVGSGLVAIAVLGALYAVLNRSWVGRAIRAAAVNPQGAELVGVNVAAVATLTFAVGVASAGAGGSIASVLYPFLPKRSPSPTSGRNGPPPCRTCS